MSFSYLTRLDEVQTSNAVRVKSDISHGQESNFPHPSCNCLHHNDNQLDPSFLKKTRSCLN